MAADEGLRKLSAILAADVAGYSRLMADDERATVRTLTEYREVFLELVERHKGRVVDTAGDSVLAIFDSVVEAVEAADEVQRQLKERNETLDGHRRMLFRIGVNLGDIIVREDGTVYGDGVNVAARLEALAAPGGVMISESAHMQIRNRLEVVFEDAGAHTVKNIAEPVRAYRVVEAGAPAARRGRRLRRLALTAAAVLALGGIGAWWYGAGNGTKIMVAADGSPTDDPALAVPGGPSIVVVPFENLSTGGEQDNFALGLSKELATALSRFRQVFVFSLDASRYLQEEGQSPAEIGQTLGARFVLSGSVVRSDNALRISASLTDAKDRALVWAETYDRNLSAEGLFDIQDDIAAGVSGRLVGLGSVTSRIGAEELELKRPSDLAAFDCVLLERAYWEHWTEEWHLKARTCLESAIEEDPSYAPAWVSLAWMISEESLSGYNANDEALERALDAARQAVRLGPFDSMTFNALANMHFFRREYDEFKVAAERALALNPNNAENVLNIGLRYAQLDMLDRGEALIEKSKRLNPYPPNWFFWGDFWIAMGRGKHDAVLEAAQNLFVDGYFLSHAALAAAYANLDRIDEANDAVARMRELVPGLTLEDTEENLRFYVGSDRLLDLMTDALRRAGLTSEALIN